MNKKPLILVFDDAWATRRSVLEPLISDQAEVRDVSFFTQESLEKGEAGVFLPPGLIVEAKPSAIIVDLAIVPSLEGAWDQGIRLLRILSDQSELREVPILVVSDYAKNPQAKALLEKASINLKGLFEWSDLQELDTEKLRFKKTIEDILRSRNVSEEEPVKSEC